MDNKIDIKKHLNQAQNEVVAVLGDVMIDQYLTGEVGRISPEAPVPVVDIQKKTYHLGGAANVAHNLASLGCKPVMFGLLGNDNKAEHFIEICKTMNIETDGLYKDKNRITTVKTRIIGNNQQMLRIDNEVITTIDEQGTDFILDKLTTLPQIDGILFEDYDKGTLNKTLIEKVIAFSKQQNIPVFVDPKFKNFSYYNGAFIFKPNKKEIENHIDKKLLTHEDIIAAGRFIKAKYDTRNVLITLGEQGMILFEDNNEIFSIPTIARKVADVSGAGDTTISTLCAMHLSGLDLRNACTIANIAAGIICQKPGVAAIEQNELIEGYYAN